jgi:hypothetical protein
MLSDGVRATSDTARTVFRNPVVSQLPAFVPAKFTKGETVTADDKFGLGAGALALGLAGGVILLAQFTPGLFDLPPGAGLVGNPPPASVIAEAVFDGIVCLLGIPTGIYFFYQGARTKTQD